MGRPLVVKYADDAYDALHQWEDATVAARHAAEREAARARAGNQGLEQDGVWHMIDGEEPVVGDWDVVDGMSEDGQEPPRLLLTDQTGVAE